MIYEKKYLRNKGYAFEYPELYAAVDENAVTIGNVTEPSENKGNKASNQAGDPPKGGNQ